MNLQISPLYKFSRGDFYGVPVGELIIWAAVSDNEPDGERWKSLKKRKENTFQFEREKKDNSPLTYFYYFS